jgi:hypothetical protein
MNGISLNNKNYSVENKNNNNTDDDNYIDNLHIVK